MTCRPKRPLIYTPTTSRRQVGRRALLRALSDEYRFGNSVSKLYASLLTQAVIEQDPRLLRVEQDPLLDRLERSKRN